MEADAKTDPHAQQEIQEQREHMSMEEKASPRPHQQLSTEDKLRESMVYVLKPGLEYVEDTFRRVIRSQVMLGKAIDRLSDALLETEDLSESLPLDEPLNSLRITRKRVKNISSTLEEIHNRLDSIKGIIWKKSITLETQGEEPHSDAQDGQTAVSQFLKWG